MRSIVSLFALAMGGCLSFTVGDAFVQSDLDGCAVVWISYGQAEILDENEEGDPATGYQCIVVERGARAQAWSDGSPGLVRIGHEHRKLVERDGNLVCPIVCRPGARQGDQTFATEAP